MYKRKDRDSGYYTNITIRPYFAKRVKLCADKAVSQSWETKLQAAVDRVRAGEPARTDELLRDGIPRQTLEVLGLVSKLAENRKRTWAEHVADYCAALAAAGKRAPKYINNARMYLNIMASECGWKLLPDASRNEFVAFTLRRRTPNPESEDKRRKAGSGLRTIKNLRDTLRSFLRWAVDERRIENQILDAARLNIDASAIAQDRRRTRRALTNDELAALFAEVADKPRSTVYMLALVSGLRWRELSLLEWRDVYLEGSRPALMLRAEATKGRRADEIALADYVAARLRANRPAAAKPTDRVFPKMPSLGTWATDLKRAGIKYKVDGKIAGFHSLRVSLGTSLERAGVSPGVRMRVMRHRDPRVSYGSYADLTLDDQHGAVNAVAVFDPVPNVAAMNGTYAAPEADSGPGTQNGHRESIVSVRNGAHPFASGSRVTAGTTNQKTSGISLENATNTRQEMTLVESKCGGKKNSPSRIRTYNLPVNSRPLYR